MGDSVSGEMGRLGCRGSTQSIMILGLPVSRQITRDVRSVGQTIKAPPLWIPPLAKNTSNDPKVAEFSLVARRSAQQIVDGPNVTRCA
jgi:hypothetical protein